MAERTCPLCGGDKWVRYIKRDVLVSTCMTRGCGYAAEEEMKK